MTMDSAKKWTQRILDNVVMYNGDDMRPAMEKFIRTIQKEAWEEAQKAKCATCKGRKFLMRPGYGEYSCPACHSSGLAQFPE